MTGRIAFFLPLAIATLFAGRAAAHTYCVPHDMSLADALQDASTGGTHANEGNTIHISTGTYATDTTAFAYVSAGGRLLEIQGGAGPSCGSGGSLDAADTILTGHGMTRVLSLHGGGGDVLAVSRLTIRDGQSATSGAGLRIVGGDFVDIDFVIISHNQSSNSDAGLFVNSDGAVSLVESVIADNSADVSNAAGTITSSASGSAHSYIANSTIVNNTAGSASDSVGGLLLTGGNDVIVDNNILWNNTHVGLYISATVIMTDNDYGAIGGDPPLAELNSLVMFQPHFVSLNGGNYHLTSDSAPLFHYGYCYGGTTADVNGNPHSMSGRCDIGAFGDTIFFESMEAYPPGT